MLLEIGEYKMANKKNDGFTDDTHELSLCAKINFKNVGELFPALKQHPMWLIAMMQLDAVVARLEKPF